MKHHETGNIGNSDNLAGAGSRAHNGDSDAPGSGPGKKDDFFKGALGDSARFFQVVLVFIVVAYCFTGIYTVKPEEVAIVQRFGRVTGATPADRVKEPGLHFAFPFPVDNVLKVPVRSVREVSITTFTKASYPLFMGRHKVVRSKDTVNPAKEGYILTGDTNIILMEFLVRYQVSDVEKYLFHHGDPEGVIRDAFRSAVLKVVGSMRVDGVLSRRRDEARRAIFNSAKEIVTEMDAGVSLLSLEISQVTPPEMLVDDFQDVTSALVEKSALIQEANGYRNSKIPAARSRANRLVREAEIFRTREIGKARSDSSKFLVLRDEYLKDPGVVSGRIYAEAMEEIWPELDRRIIIPFGGDGSQKIFLSPVED